MGEIIFYDETGLNPLPAGLFVTIYAAPQPPTNPNWRRVNNLSPLPAYDGMTTGGGVFSNPNIALQSGGSYGAEFSGEQAPGMCSAHFIATAHTDDDGNPLPTVATADNFRSPTLSQPGYALAQTQLWPRGWFSDDALANGGVAYALAYALAGVLGSPIINGLVDADSADRDVGQPTLNNQIPNVGHWSLDESTQQLLESMRLEACQGSDIDSWAFDVFGNVIQRCINDSDYEWIQKIIEILTIFRVPGLITVAGLQQLLDLLYPCLVRAYQQELALNNQGGMDNWGGLDIVPAPPGVGPIAMGFDVFGAMDIPTTFMDISSNPVPVTAGPNIIVFDAQTRPDLAALISPNIVPPQFCVYFQYEAFSDALIHPIVPFIPTLAALVNACKAAGTQVVYAANVT